MKESGKNLFEMARSTESILENSLIDESFVEEKYCYPDFPKRLGSCSKDETSSQFSNFTKKKQ